MNKLSVAAIAGILAFAAVLGSIAATNTGVARDVASASDKLDC